MIIIGYLGLIAGFGFLGLLKARQIKKRPQEIREMINALALLDTEIFWGATPLPEAFGIIKERVDAPWKIFFADMEKRIMKGEKALSAWENTIQKNRKYFSLEDDDWKVITGIGKSLGRSDRNEQHKQFELVHRHLHALNDKAGQQAEVKAKMWSYLGFLGGLAIVIIII